MGGSGGIEGVGGDVTLSGFGRKGKNVGKMAGSDVYDDKLEAYTDQAVEVTERRTVLIR